MLSASVREAYLGDASLDARVRSDPGQFQHEVTPPQNLQHLARFCRFLEAMSTVFGDKKKRIIEQLQVPETEYNDLSPKGSIDIGIRELLDDINAIPTLVSTSSCAGRVSVYVEGQKQYDASVDASDSVVPSSGGKGGGRWLFVSHDPVLTKGSLAHHIGFEGMVDQTPPGLHQNHALVHFKFEAMVGTFCRSAIRMLTNMQILHLMAASLKDAKLVLGAASSAGFRESGAMGFTAKNGSTTPMVAVRCNGLALDSVIGYMDEHDKAVCIVSEEHLNLLNNIATERFRVNTERIQRFRVALLKAYSSDANDDDLEDRETRKTRKKHEGLAKQEALRAQKATEEDIVVDEESP